MDSGAGRQDSEDRTRGVVHVEAVRGGWAVKHGAGFLGFANSEGEARRIVEHLAAERAPAAA